MKKQPVKRSRKKSLAALKALTPLPLNVSSAASGKFKSNLVLNDAILLDNYAHFIVPLS